MKNIEKHYGSNITELPTNSSCSKNPNGKHHSLYEGSEKSKYTCKYCGINRPSISSLTSSTCSKNPDGKHHVPSM